MVLCVCMLIWCFLHSNRFCTPWMCTHWNTEQRQRQSVHIIWMCTVPETHSERERQASTCLAAVIPWFIFKCRLSIFDQTTLSWPVPSVYKRHIQRLPKWHCVFSIHKTLCVSIYFVGGGLMVYICRICVFARINAFMQEHRFILPSVILHAAIHTRTHTVNNSWIVLFIDTE